MVRNCITGPFCGFFLAALPILGTTVQLPGLHVARPGTINYVEGQASLGTMPLNPKAIEGLEVARGQSVTTMNGKVEILLTPGVFLRLADNSSLTMVSPELANTEVQLDKGRAMVEVLDIRKENDIRIAQNGATTRLRKKGLYEFDADLKEVRVFEGSVDVNEATRHATPTGGEKVVLNGEKLKAIHFDRRQYEDDFYRWGSLRSGYLSEASVDIARTYVGPGPGWFGPGWYGVGWYWDPWFGAYTFLPVDGVFWSPFGWGFYSPIAVYRTPYLFYGHFPHVFSEYHYPYGHGLPAPGWRGRR